MPGRCLLSTWLGLETRVLNNLQSASAAKSARDTTSSGRKPPFSADGKMLPDVTVRARVERLPVLVGLHYGLQVEQILGLPKFMNGTGEAVSNAVVIIVQEWGVESLVKAMCFDTTASNTGRRIGACGVIETRLGKNLLHLACWHHVYEIVVWDVFKHCFGLSSGPDFGLFWIFRTFGHNRSQFQMANHDPICVEVLMKLVRLKYNVIFLAKQVLLSSQQMCNDYRELLELTVLFLGVIGYSTTCGTNYGSWSIAQSPVDGQLAWWSSLSEGQSCTVWKSWRLNSNSD